MSKKSDKEEGLARLHEWIKPGDTVYTVLRNVSRSGMQREIGIILMRDGEPLHPNYAAGKVLDYRVGKRDRLIVGGCGMDMGFHLVYNLGRALFPDGFGCIGNGCQSNDHSNGDRDYTPHGAGQVVRWNGADDYTKAPALWELDGPQHWHKDGGYALRHKWL